MPVKKKAVSAKAAGRSRSGARLSKKPPLTPAQLKQIDAYWRAANYLTACQLYLLDNPLLRASADRRRPEADHCRPLGYLSGAELHLHPSGSGHQAG